VKRFQQRPGGGGNRDGVLLPPRLTRWGAAAWSIIGILILLYVVYRFVLYPIRIVFPPLVVALVIVYLLNPIVTRLGRRGIPRVWGTLLTYVVFLTMLGVAMRFLIPAVAHQVATFGDSLPGLLQRAQSSVDDVNRSLGTDIDLNQLARDLGPGGTGSRFLSQLFSYTVGVLKIVFTLVLGILVAFYLLVDLPRIRAFLESVIPVHRRPEAHALTGRVGQALGGYFRGQLLVATFVGLASVLGLYIVGLPYWAPIGLLAGLFNVIPLIGPYLAGVVAVFVAFTTTSSGGLLHVRPGLPLAIGAALALLVVQQIDNHVVTPNVIGRTVHLHPVTVMLALLAAGSLFGLWGMLLVVPTIGAIKAALLYFWDSRMRWPPSAEEFAEPPGDEAAEPPPGEKPRASSA
jgi:predicted PurR-regulated permease PerM